MKNDKDFNDYVKRKIKRKTFSINHITSLNIAK